MHVTGNTQSSFLSSLLSLFCLSAYWCSGLVLLLKIFVDDSTARHANLTDPFQENHPCSLQRTFPFLQKTFSLSQGTFLIVPRKISIVIWTISILT